MTKGREGDRPQVRAISVMSGSATAGALRPTNPWIVEFSSKDEGLSDYKEFGGAGTSAAKTNGKAVWPGGFLICRQDVDLTVLLVVVDDAMVPYG